MAGTPTQCRSVSLGTALIGVKTSVLARVIVS
jgi:hypothetical protein